MGTGDLIEWGDAAFQKACKQASEGVLRARGVRLTERQLADVLNVAPRDPDDPERRLLQTADLEGTTFQGEAKFEGVTFSGDANFRETTFSGVARFKTATFNQGADFAGATFPGLADFGWTTFADGVAFSRVTCENATFTGATFHGGLTWFEGTFGHANFGWATFRGETSFSTTFSGLAFFQNARFHGETNFGGTFERGANFVDVTFDDEADFERVNFGTGVGFINTKFDGEARFGLASFGDRAMFRGAIFTKNARFDGASFGSQADFRWVEFRSHTSFSDAAFGGQANFRGTSFLQDVTFSMADLKQTFEFGPMLVLGGVELGGASFDAVELRVAADRLSLRRTRFHGPANLQLRRAETTLDGAVFEASSLLAQSEAFSVLPASDDQEQERLDRLAAREENSLAPRCDGRFWPTGQLPFASSAPVWQSADHMRRTALARTAAPRIVSVPGASVGNLAMSEVDLRACRFQGADGLDRLRLEGVEFADTPSGWQRWRWPLSTRLTRRQVIAEECELRTGTEWSRPETDTPAWLAGTPTLEPEQVAAIYRALRKGREDTRDEPGAADFYYGEMEMRRQHRREGASEAIEHSRETFARRPRQAESTVVWLYWLVSGYGLRASRALIGLAVTVLGGAVLLHAFGFSHPRSVVHSVIFSLDSTVSLLRAPTGVLTSAGQFVEIALRLLGPLFFGLALISLRGRVKR